MREITVVQNTCCVYVYDTTYKLLHMKPLINHADDTEGHHQPVAPAGKWLSKKEVLGLLFISERTLQHWRSRKIIPYYRIGNKIYYRQSDIEKLLESRRVGGS
jgi:hypothetical protein